jgi:hypothetical protein
LGVDCLKTCLPSSPGTRVGILGQIQSDSCERSHSFINEVPSLIGKDSHEHISLNEFSWLHRVFTL